MEVYRIVMEAFISSAVSLGLWYCMLFLLNFLDLVELRAIGCIKTGSSSWLVIPAISHCHSTRVLHLTDTIPVKSILLFSQWKNKGGEFVNIHTALLSVVLRVCSQVDEENKPFSCPTFCSVFSKSCFSSTKYIIQPWAMRKHSYFKV